MQTETLMHILLIVHCDLVVVVFLILIKMDQFCVMWGVSRFHMFKDIYVSSIISMRGNFKIFKFFVDGLWWAIVGGHPYHDKWPTSCFGIVKAEASHLFNNNLRLSKFWGQRGHEKFVQGETFLAWPLWLKNFIIPILLLNVRDAPPFLKLSAHVLLFRKRFF